jgi:hypothetical protein
MAFGEVGAEEAGADQLGFRCDENATEMVKAVQMRRGRSQKTGVKWKVISPKELLLVELDRCCSKAFQSIL